MSLLFEYQLTKSSDKSSINIGKGLASLELLKSNYQQSGGDENYFIGGEIDEGRIKKVVIQDEISNK